MGDNYELDGKTAGQLEGTQVTHAKADKDLDDVPAVKGDLGGLQPPEFLRNMSFEERLELETRLKRKIDLRLMPPVMIMYLLNYMDRNNIASAKLAGLMQELNLDSTQFATCVSILFAGYMLMQVPSNLLLNKIGRPGLYLPTTMMIWGAISAATAGCQSYGSLVAVRFLLGFVEAPFLPGVIYTMSCWYTRKELGFRIAVLYSGALMAGAFSGLIAAGITGNMEGVHGLRAWKWLFIIEGTITVGVALISYFVLPNFPRTTGWLTEEERQLAIWRLEEDVGEDDWIDSEHQTFWKGAKMAFLDPKTYVLSIMLFGMIAASTVTNFFPTVVQTLGYSNVTTLLLTTPPYVLAVITSYINGLHSDKTGERYFHVTIPMWFSVAAFIIAATTMSFGPRYLSMIIMVPAVYTGYGISLGWISNVMPRPPAKRAAAMAFINAASITCNIYASYMYPASAAPQYTVAMIVNCIMSFVCICAATLLRFMLASLNKKLEQGIYVEGAINAHGFRFKL